MRYKELTDDYIQGRKPSNAKNYLRKGGNKQQFKWRIELQNGKVLLRWADTRYNAVHGQLSTNQLIIGVKSAVRVKAAPPEIKESKQPFFVIYAGSVFPAVMIGPSSFQDNDYEVNLDTEFGGILHVKKDEMWTTEREARKAAFKQSLARDDREQAIHGKLQPSWTRSIDGPEFD